MYSATSSTHATSSGMRSLPPAAFSWPPPLKYVLAHPFAEVPLRDLTDILIFPSSSFASMLILTLAMERGMFTNPSVSPSATLYLAWSALSSTMYATPSSVIVRRSFIICPITLRRFSPNWLNRLNRILSLSTPIAMSSEAMLNVDGYTELLKLLVSVVIPVMRAVAVSAGRFSAFKPIAVVRTRIW